LELIWNLEFNYYYPFYSGITQINMNSPKGVIIEIRAGTGGDEAALFAMDLYKMYSRFAQSRGWPVSVVDSSASSLGGFKEISLEINSSEAYNLLKQEGGVLEHLLWEVQVECLPTDIPQKLEVDVSNLKIGDALFIKDISVPKGVKILNDPEVRIFAVEKPIEIKPEEVAAEAETAPTEPEVLKQKKPEEIAAEEAAKAAAKAKEKEKKEQTHTRKLLLHRFGNIKETNIQKQLQLR